jgi:hypothetical protein
MEKFLLLLREDYAVREKMTPEAREISIQAMMEWIESLDRSGNYLKSEPLSRAGSYVSKDYVLSDGPFIESKEAISGYMMINAENLEQATEIVQTCPLVLNDGYIMEVRPVGQKSCRE